MLKYTFLGITFLPLIFMISFCLGYTLYVTFYDLIHGYGAYYG